MSRLHCCQEKSRAGDDARPQRTSRRRPGDVAGLILPGALLALLPKCPMCLAAYVAVCTGFTLSRSSAHILMRSLTALCLGMLALCAVRHVLSCRQNKQPLNLQPTPSSR